MPRVKLAGCTRSSVVSTQAPKDAGGDLVTPLDDNRRFGLGSDAWGLT